MSDLRNRIRKTALEHFFRFGFVSVSMDEIAAEFGISKKTLYQHFASKKDLLREGLEQKVDEIASGLDSILGRSSLEYPAKLQEVMRFMSRKLPRPGKRFFRDMASNASDVWRPIHDRRSSVIRTRFGRLFREGVEEGFLRDDLGADFLLLIFTRLIESVLNPETLAEQPLTAAQAFEKISSIVWLGVLTDKGRKLYRPPRAREAMP